MARVRSSRAAKWRCSVGSGFLNYSDRSMTKENNHPDDLREFMLKKVSHEMRAPLAAIVSLLQVLDDEAAEFTDEHRRMVGRARARARSLILLIDDLRRYWRLRSPGEFSSRAGGHGRDRRGHGRAVRAAGPRGRPGAFLHHRALHDPGRRGTPPRAWSRICWPTRSSTLRAAGESRSTLHATRGLPASRSPTRASASMPMPPAISSRNSTARPRLAPHSPRAQAWA